MDKRFRPISFEIIIFIAIFLYIFHLKIILDNISSPLVIILLLFGLAEFIRILYELRTLKKEGVNIDEQGSS